MDTSKNDKTKGTEQLCLAIFVAVALDPELAPCVTTCTIKPNSYIRLKVNILSACGTI